MHEQIRQVLSEHARLSVDIGTLPDDADLFDYGLTSHGSISVMLALEDSFDLEFPDEMLTRNVFSSVGAIAGAISALLTPHVG